MRYSPATALRQLAVFTPKEWLLSVLGGALLLGLYAINERWDRIALWGCLLLAALLTHLCAAAMRWLLPRDAGWSWCWAGLLMVLLAVACASTLLYLEVVQFWRLRALSPLQALGSAFVFSALVSGVPLLIAQRESAAARLAELERAAAAAELKSLQAQVEPHFLYNTLANTRYLVRHAPERAVEMLDHLIAYLRTALPDMRTASSTLGRECELAGHYLAVMELRFGARLTTSIVCPDTLRDTPVPPMLLMSLVENAVRHGVEPKPGAVRVSVKAALRADGALGIVVRDDGAGLDAPSGKMGAGVGLRNVRERLQALYRGHAGFELRRAPDGATEAELRLPLAAGEVA